MTAKELIKALQDLGEEHLNKRVLCYDEYRYVPIERIKIIEESHWDGSNEECIGID